MVSSKMTDQITQIDDIVIKICYSITKIDDSTVNKIYQMTPRGEFHLLLLLILLTVNVCYITTYLVCLNMGKVCEEVAAAAAVHFALFFQTGEAIKKQVVVVVDSHVMNMRILNNKVDEFVRGDSRCLRSQDFPRSPPRVFRWASQTVICGPSLSTREWRGLHIGGLGGSLVDEGTFWS